ncbi:hypothetical protein GPECTOR_83g296 [Gonium pectorale]|uniref:Uncharacterized protein n=1 Tax=Gonium pectorale TaxID=33097 RepID=A0A150G1I6_GONPE|nr:hypothetical protein GPECTOR_83g296 [Gonium pectorale]|eukprot:KXZ43684.1 hypothetical protein GPECTOR_83g296 [Gonium pectorale]
MCTAARNPAFHALKFRLRLGKQFFLGLGALAAGGPEPLGTIQGVGSGPGALQSVYSNCVPAATVPRVTDWLTTRMGFRLVNSKASATVHVIDQTLNVHYKVSLALPEEGSPNAVQLRKMSGLPTVCHTVALLSRPDGLDLRLELIGQRREPEDCVARSLARAVVSACNAVGYDSFAASGGRSHLPRDMALDLVRKKRKQVYEGEFQASSGCRLRLQFAVVNLEDKDGGASTEITGSMPELDLQAAKALSSRGGGAVTGPGGARDSGRWSADALAALKEFLSTLNTASLGAGEDRARVCAASRVKSRHG